MHLLWWPSILQGINIFQNAYITYLPPLPEELTEQHNMKTVPAYFESKVKTD